MEYIGQTKSILIPVKTEVWGTFTVVQKTNQNKPTALCEEDPPILPVALKNKWRNMPLL